MSALSQFTGGGIPIGASLLALDAPINFTSGAAEYLRTGSIKAYDASYATAISAAPQLRVFGNDAKTYGIATAAYTCRYFYVAGNYICPGLNYSSGYYGALNALTGGAVNAGYSGTVASNASHLVYSTAANLALNYTTTGAVVTAVGGVFTSYPVPSAMLFANNSWLALSTLGAIAGEQAYINNAVPTGTWTVGASTNIGMTACKGLAYGAGVFVVVGTSASATAGKIATTATVGSAWTDRTSAAGIIFTASESIVDVVFSGSNFVATSSANRILTSPDGINWTARGEVFDDASVHPLSGVGSWAGGGVVSGSELTTDGAGVVVAQPAFNFQIRPIFAISTDHGVTWSVAQIYIGKAPANGTRTISYANGRWIANYAGSCQSCVDIGTSLTVPDFVGNQYQLGAGQFVRIK